MQFVTPRRIMFHNMIAALLMTSVLASSQENTTVKDSTPAKRLRSQAIAKGFIGGESHDSYVIHVRKGEKLTVQISWRREGDNCAEFTVSESANGFNGEPVKFGVDSKQGKSWSGAVPRTGDYYIYVVAHPTANYALRVTIK